MSKYAIVDLEMCKVPRGEVRKQYNYATEIIQIGAVIVDEKYEITESFMTHVQPQFGALDEYIVHLTGITQDDLAEAPYADEALQRFTNWLPEDSVLVTWSPSDEHQLRAEMMNKQLSIPRLEEKLDHVIDCQKTFTERMKAERSYKLSEALNITALWYDDGAHDAFIDAKNTALLFIKMENEPDLKLSPYLVSDDSDDTLGFSPFANLHL